MNNYPLPKDNPHCKCANGFQQQFCMTGHMTECHYPYDCEGAGCTHLPRYDYPIEEAEFRAAEARAAMASGSIPIYRSDEHNNISAIEITDQQRVTDQEQYNAELIRLHDEGVEIVTTFDIIKVTFLISNIQIGLRHPANTGAAASVAYEATNELINQIELHSPHLAVFLRRGFDPAWDTKAEK